MTVSDAIKKLAKNDSDTVLIATVESFDVQERTCLVSPIGGQAPLTARLQATIGQDKGWVIIPSVGSVVIVTMINDETGFVSVCSDIDYIKAANGTADLATELEKMIEVMDETLGAMLNLKVITPAGPSTALTPDSITAITQERTKLSGVKGKILTLIK